MASNGNYHYGINDRERLELGHRMLLAEQQRRLESRRILEVSTSAPVCPYYSVVGHSGCWYCRHNGTTQPSKSTDNLLRSLARPQFQTAPVSAKSHASYLSSSGSTQTTTIQPNQLITPVSTASTVPLADDSPQNQNSHQRMIYSNPRGPVLAPSPVSGSAVAATPLAKATKPKQEPPLPWVELPLPKNFVPVEVPETFFRFLLLPVEIRHLIYAYLVDNGIHGLVLPSKEVKSYHQAPITRVNRQIRRESIDLVYTNNAFDASSRDLIKRGLTLTRRVGDARIKLIRSWNWVTAKRSLSVEFSDNDVAFEHRGSNEEVRALALERLHQVYAYLNSLPYFTIGFGVEDVQAITEIVLRITPKVKAKKEEETVQ